MWTLACSITDKYADLKDLFYQRARRYVEADYVKGYGEHMISVAHCQTHTLLAAYEMKMMYFSRAWINTGSAVRLAQMCVELGRVFVCIMIIIIYQTDFLPLGLDCTEWMALGWT